MLGEIVGNETDLRHAELQFVVRLCDLHGEDYTFARNGTETGKPEEDCKGHS